MSLGVERAATASVPAPSGVGVGDGGAEVPGPDGGPGVTLVPWPSGDDERRVLAARSAPRLLLVDGETAPPVCVDPLEDWVRVPASDADIAARAAALSQRAALRPSTARPEIDTDGVVRMGRQWTALPPVEARLMSALVERFGAVVHRDDLAAAGWPDGLPGRNALDVHVLRLRRRIAPVGLVIRTIRARGYLLEVAVGAPQP